MFARAQQAPAKTLIQAPVPTIQQYVLGPDDQVKIWALGFEELSDKPMRIDPGGYLDLPMIGQIKAAGLTPGELQSALVDRLKTMVLKPQVSVSIVDYGSQPVSVIGAVNQPGIHQLQGRRTLAEMISMAGGLRQDAGSVIKITREVQYGPIPLPTATQDPTGQYTTAEIMTADLLAAKSPAENILIRPRDVVTVPVADTISVVGAVQHAGAFPLNTRTNVTVLEALALAGGYAPQPQPQNAKILRITPGSMDRKEIPVNLSKIQAGKEEDVALRPYDILLIPTSNSKKLGVHLGEAALAAVVGFAIWHGM
jgi:polysaccharide export outer membrane protein